MKSYVRNKTLYFIPEENLVSENLMEHRDLMLKKLKKPSSFKDIVFNFKSVNSIDSGGISLLIGLRKEISPLDKTLKIIELDESLTKVFNIFNLNELIETEQEETLS